MKKKQNKKQPKRRKPSIERRNKPNRVDATEEVATEEVATEEVARNLINASLFTRYLNSLKEKKDMQEGQRAVEALNFQDFEQPIVELHSGSKVSKLKTSELMLYATETAGSMVIDKNTAEMAHTYFKTTNFPNPNLKLDDLQRIVIKEDGSDNWSVKFHYSEGTAQEQEMYFPFATRLFPFDIDLAKQVAETYVALSIYYEGNSNPENSIQERTFQYGDANISVNKNFYIDIKKFLKENWPSNEKPDMTAEIAYLQEYAGKFGGKITNDSLRQINHSDFNMLNVIVASLLVQGVKRWPPE